MSAEAITESVQLNRLFNAPVERVFEAWTDPDMLAQWFGPEHFEVLEANVDCRPNGKYSIVIQSPEKQTIKHFGDYLKVEKPTSLVFTWILENQRCQGSSGQTATTIVELRFAQQGDKTLLHLRHDKLPDSAAVNGHRLGWQSSLQSLDLFLQ